MYFFSCKNNIYAAMSYHLLSVCLSVLCFLLACIFDSAGLSTRLSFIEAILLFRTPSTTMPPLIFDTETITGILIPAQQPSKLLLL